jgi:SAM-dependent methyltransferase
MGSHDKADPFVEAAKYYHYRPAYVRAAIEWISGEMKLDGRGRMLDVGCGTGHVCREFEGKFEEIVGVDPSEEMLRVATGLGIGGFGGVKLRAEELPAGLGAFRMIAFGASFHRTDRDRVLEVVYEMLEVGGGLALLFPSVPWKGDEGWKVVLREVIGKWTGEDLARPIEPSQNLVARSRFGKCEVRDFSEGHRWSAEQICGFMLSTSFCSPTVLGEGVVGEFKAELLERLMGVCGDDRFLETITTTVVLSRRS